MDWSKVESMDPDMLVGIVNTALRNHYGDLDELCRAEDVDQDALCQRLASGGYDYNAEAKQFR